MTTRKCSNNAIATTHDLDSGMALSITGGRGTVVRCLEGQVWLTQEGDAQDYFLAANTRYHAVTAGSIVVNALVAPARIAVYRTAAAPAGDWRRNGVRLDAGFIDGAMRLARRERARTMTDLSIRGRWCLRGMLRRLAGIGARALHSVRGRCRAHP